MNDELRAAELPDDSAPNHIPVPQQPRVVSVRPSADGAYRLPELPGVSAEDGVALEFSFRLTRDDGAHLAASAVVYGHQDDLAAALGANTQAMVQQGLDHLMAMPPAEPEPAPAPYPPLLGPDGTPLSVGPRPY